MRADRASDLHLVREIVEAGACAPPVVTLTERQQDQQAADRLRADYRARADAVSTPDEPIDPEWDGVKL